MTLITGNVRPTARSTAARSADGPAIGAKTSPASRGRGPTTRRRTRRRPMAPGGSPTPVDSHPQTVIFVDIPMTAGPAMRSVVKRQYSPGEVIAVYRPLMEDTLAELRALDEDRKRRSRFLIGHVSFGVHELLPDPPACKYVTVLRDPVERVIDEYEYIRRTKQHFLHEQVRRMSLKDFAAAGLANGTENGQTKYLTQSRWSSLPGREENTGAGAVGALAANALEQAKRNLEQHFLVVGLTEELDATLLMMKRRLGWRMPFYAGRAQPPIPQTLRSAAPADAIATIEQHNDLDLRLYDWARNRFDETLQNTGMLFHAELRGFQALNAWYGFHRRGGR